MTLACVSSKFTFLVTQTIIILSVIYTFENAIAAEFKCDLKGSLNAISKKSVITRDAKNFKKRYDRQYAIQESALKEFSKSLKPASSDGLTAFFKTEKGDESFKALVNIKKTFGYDGVAAYLFDSETFNTSPEFYTGTITKDD